MMFLEIHVITICAIICAIKPARELWRPFANWMERQANHREHLKRLERENG